MNDPHAATAVEERALGAWASSYLLVHFSATAGIGAFWIGLPTLSNYVFGK